MAEAKGLTADDLPTLLADTVDLGRLDCATSWPSTPKLIEYWKAHNQTLPTALSLHAEEAVVDACVRIPLVADILCGASGLKQGDHVSLKASELEVATFIADARGEIHFSSPLLIAALPYMELALCLTDKRVDKIALHHKLVLKPEQREKLFAPTGPWQFGPDAALYEYRRGALVTWV